VPVAVVIGLSPSYQYAVMASAGMLVVGLILILMGLRGRRIDEHPLCRRCGFDLVARPEGAENCSECGAGLGRRRAIRIGNRAKRWGFALLGLLLVLEMGAWLAVQGVQELKRRDLTAYKPVGWLVAEARGKDAQQSDAAMKRLVQLFNDGELNDRQNRKVVGLILAAQADASRNWSKELGLALEQAYEQGRLKEEEWQTYWRQAWNVSIRVRGEVSRGGDLPLLVVTGVVPRDSGRVPNANAVITRVKLQGMELVVPPFAPPRPSRPTGGVRDRTVTLSLLPLAAKLRDGPQTVEAEVVLHLYEMKNVLQRRGEVPTKRIVVPVRAEFLLHPPEHPTVVLMSDQELRTEMQESITTEGIYVSRRQGSIEQDMSCRITISKPPCHTAFTVSVRQRGLEWQLGVVECDQRTSGTVELTGRADELSETKAELVLRPAPQQAASTVHVKEIWGDAVILGGVPVKNEIHRPLPANQRR
jgi:hypothetical protein